MTTIQVVTAITFEVFDPNTIHAAVTLRFYATSSETAHALHTHRRHARLRPFARQIQGAFDPPQRARE